MRFVLFVIIITLSSNLLLARQFGETEITAEEGVEVFQDEKYYLLRKNVKIVSDNFTLTGDIIKIFFEKDLYDITTIDAKGKVKLESSINKLNAKGDKLYFVIKNEEIMIEGIDSKLVTEDIEMYSDGIIKVNNIEGDFYLDGSNSKLINEDITIEGKKINGIFYENNNVKEISKLNVYDENISYIKTNKTEMYANIIKYNDETSLIELESNVKIISESETITGDYGTLNTNTNSYKVKSKDSKRVKVIITNND